ncbi:hypothetical protein FACS1894155_07040 [Bacteroidia bacterium]|nr:hypothetical protein FACS1894155_07040 [Bacteroidia bacterium]
MSTKTDNLNDLIIPRRLRFKKEKIDTKALLSLCEDIIADKEEDDKNKKYARFIKAVCLVEEKEWNLSINELKKLGYSDYWIYKQKNEQLYERMICNNLKDHGIEEDKESEKFGIYFQGSKDIHDCIFEIMDCLIVEKVNLQVSHYTGRNTVEKLLFEKSLFRMCSMATANDKSEGKIIYEFLGHPDWYKKEKFQQCFIACFTFDANCLNHFRLYGKENEKEATGVSLCFKAGSFDCSISKQLKLKTKEEFDKDYYISPLFRCLYIYPKEDNVELSVASIGHTEYSELKEESGEHEKKARHAFLIEEKKEVEENLKKIRKRMDRLKSIINNFMNTTADDENKRIEIVSRILLNLTYMVKHAAFREEQECRLFSIQKLKGANHIRFCDHSRKMYMEYKLPINELKRITFAPKTSEYLLFKDRLEQEEFENVECIQSELPIA